MAKTDERKAYDALRLLHYPPGRGRKTVSDKVKKQIEAALAKAEASEATTPRPNPRSAASRDAARDARAEKQGLKDDELVKKMEKRGALKKAGKSQRFRPAPLPVQEVDELKAVPVKTAEKLRKSITANFTDGVKFKKGPGSDVSKTDLAKATKALSPKKEDGLTEGKFGTRAGKDAIQSFFQTTFGYTPTVTYDDPAKFGDQTESYGKKKGGRVTSKRPTAKKYAMNRGGKVASVRKPTRA
jgi:hypothetical protein